MTPAVRDDSDETLMLRYRDGEVRAFELLLTRHRKPVYNFILRFVKNQTQAEDLLQETFLRVIKGAASYQRQAKFTTWLYTIARNLCVDASRRGRFRQASSLEAPLGAGESRALGDVIADPGHPVDRQVQGQEIGTRIEAALATLVEEQREVFVMRELLDMSFKEIAEVVGCSENTIKSRMRYALEKLRDRLEDYREDVAQVAQ